MPRRTILIDRGWRRISAQALGLNGRAVKVGIRADGAGGAANDGVQIVDIATYNEFGTEHIPARPFMRRTADEQEKAVGTFAQKLAGQVIAGKMNPDGLLDALGLWYVARIRDTIRSAFRWAAPNAPSTIRRKGSSKPLIDTGAMIGAVDYQKTRTGRS